MEKIKDFLFRYNNLMALGVDRYKEAWEEMKNVQESLKLLRAFIFACDYAEANITRDEDGRFVLYDGNKRHHDISLWYDSIYSKED